MTGLGTPAPGFVNVLSGYSPNQKTRHRTTVPDRFTGRDD